MTQSRSASLLAALLLVPSLAFAQSTAPAPAAPATQTTTKPAPQQRFKALMVLNAKGATLTPVTLSLDGVAATAILFADRPVRRAGHISTTDLVKLWANGSFAKDPPNANVSAFARDGSRLTDAVVVLKAPKVVGDRLTFDVAILEGDLRGADGPATIFIDTIWFGVGSGGVDYLGQNQTTGGTSSAFGSRDDTSNPSGWSNPSPDGTTRSMSPPGAPPLSAPPGYK